jgi:hypothetical protein
MARVSQIEGLDVSSGMGEWISHGPGACSPDCHVWFSSKLQVESASLLVFHATIFGAPGMTPVVVISELSDNPGPSVRAAFSEVARRVREVLPSWADEPVWIERWSERALADFLVRGQTSTATHLWREGDAGWISRPLAQPAAAQLLDLAHLCQTEQPPASTAGCTALGT